MTEPGQPPASSVRMEGRAVGYGRVYQAVGTQIIHDYGRPSRAAVPGTPTGRALLNDPLQYMELGDVFARAEELVPDSPAQAAELFGQLAERLDDGGFPVHAVQLRDRERDLHQGAGETAVAFAITMRLLLDRYDSGGWTRGEAHRAAELAQTLGSPATEAAVVATALDDWFERGYDLTSVSQALAVVVAANDPLACRLVLAVAEQVVADDDPDDDPAALAAVAAELVEGLAGVVKVRVECCIADLAVRAGTDPAAAFSDLSRRALGGYIPEEQAALVHMRSGRALAFAGRHEDAIEVYRRAVLAAAGSGHGGDARDALRSIFFLSSLHGLGLEAAFNAMRSAQSVASRDRLIPSAGEPAVSTLEALVDGKLPDASREAHRWVRQSRISGALLDEIVARRRYGEVFAQAGMLPLAIRQLVLAGAQDEAVSTARAAPEPVDMAQLLDLSANWVRASAAAVVRAQADLVPDLAVGALVAKLVSIVEQGDSPGMGGPQPVTEALGALGALGRRLPADAARSLLSRMRQLVPRETGQHHPTDDEMLIVFDACAHAGAPDVAAAAVDALVEAMRRSVHRAATYVTGMGPETPGLLDTVQSLAADGDATAVLVLADWNVPAPSVVAAARAAAAGILAEPVGTVRTSFGIGSGAGRCALLLRAALTPGAAELTGTEPLTALRDRVVQHLLGWAEDRDDVAASRAGAVTALQILAERLPPELRTTVWRRLIAVHDDPGVHELDLLERQSQHRLSRFQFNEGGQYLAAACLLAAAAAASDADQAVEIEQRLLPALAAAVTDGQDAALRAATILALNPLRVLPLDQLASHPAPAIRRAAAICWGSDPDRYPALSAMFADDPDRHVRQSIGTEMARLHTADHDRYADALERLAADPSERVRRAAAAPPISS